MFQRILLARVALLGWTLGSVAIATAGQPGPDLTQVKMRLGALAVPFISNAGQWSAGTAFAAHTFAGTLLVTTEGQLVYNLPGTAIGEAAAERLRTRLEDAPRQPDRRRASGGVLTETLVDAEGRALSLAPIGSQPQPTRISYFTGNEVNHRGTEPAAFEGVSLGEPAPGIVVHLRAIGNNVEKIFTIGPAGDPNNIRVRLRGADRLEAGPHGELIAHTGNGPVVFTPPLAFEEDAAGKRSAVAVRYALAGDRDGYGFVLGDYDRSHTVVIDPLLQATYYGSQSGGNDQINAIAIDPATGLVWVAGFVSSISGDKDAFVTSFTPSLIGQVGIAYLAGGGDDQINAIAIDPVSGDVLVAGTTGSGDFPCTTPPNCAVGAQPNYGGGSSEGFVARFNSTVTVLRQATYLGSSGVDVITALAIHPVSGEVLVAGSTTSTTFPCTTTATAGCTNGARSANAGGTDGFVARLNPGLTGLLQATYLGGSGFDVINAMAIHPVSGEVLVAGATLSADLPCTTNALLGCSAGAQAALTPGPSYKNGFVARFNTSLTRLLQATYLGGSGFDEINAMAIHPVSGEVLVAGTATSVNFPCTTNASAGCGTGAQQANASGGGADGFVARLDPSLTRLLQSTYLGGAGVDIINAIAIHPANGEVLVGGYTTSTNLPCTTSATAGCNTAAQSALAVGGIGDNDAFAARLNAGLTRLLEVTYLGGSASDVITAIAVHPVSGEVVVAGYTDSTNFPCTTSATAGCSNGAQPAHSPNIVGPDDGFVARISSGLTFDDSAANPFAFVPQSNVALSSVRTSTPVLITGIGSSGTNVYVEGQAGSTYAVSNTNSCSGNVSGGFTALPGIISAGSYVCLRHTASAAANQLTRTNFHVGGAMASFLVTTGTLVGPACSLDTDGNGSIDALTDGLMILRAMFGLTGTAVTQGALGGGATRSTWAQIQPYLNGNCGTNFAP